MSSFASQKPLDIKTYLGISNILNKFLPISLEVGLGFGLGLDITNSKKKQKNRKPSYGILLFDLASRKNYKHEL